MRAGPRHSCGHEFFLQVAEEFRRLSGGLQARCPSAKNLLVTSVAGGEGTTTVAVNLARALAENPAWRVLVVDANLRSPIMHEVFSLELSPGLCDCDGRTSPHWQETADSPNLFVLTAGGVREGSLCWAGEATKIGIVVKEVKEHFDFVVWDSPPVARFPDALVLARLVDGVLVVVEEDLTKEDALDFVRGQLAQADATVVGAVLNRRGRFIPRWLRFGS